MGLLNEHDAETSVFNQPGLQYPTVSGVTGQTNGFFIPIHLTSYAPADRKPTVSSVGVLPILVPSSNLAIGTDVVSVGPTSLPRLSFEGHIDTPTVADTDTYKAQGALVQVPAILQNGLIRITWAEFIMMCFEGRADSNYVRLDPLWFRDPYGRRYDNPKVLDFSANYVEAVPGRTTFTMSLKV